MSREKTDKDRATASEQKSHLVLWLISRGTGFKFERMKTIPLISFWIPKKEKNLSTQSCCLPFRESRWWMKLVLKPHDCGSVVCSPAASTLSPTEVMFRLLLPWPWHFIGLAGRSRLVLWVGNIGRRRHPREVSSCADHIVYRSGVCRDCCT